MPYTRGAEHSRPAPAVRAEARRLVAQGAREITLLGQNVNAWHGAGPDGTEQGLGALIRQLSTIPELRRIRYTTSHPRDMDDDLIAAHADVPALMPFLHLPVQSWLGPRAGGDEPAPHRRSGLYLRTNRATARRRAPTSRSPPTSSSATPARPRRISGRPSTWSKR